MHLEKVFTDNAPKPAGHYSQAIKAGNLLFVSGQLPVVPGSSDRTVGSIEEQARQALKNLKAVLEASGSGVGKVVKTTVYISDIKLWDAVNTVYAEFFGSHKPARSIVPSRELHFGYQLEVEAIAVI